MKNIITKLVKKCESSNPIDIIRFLNIKIIYEELGSINGYYNSSFRSKFIHINNNLPEHLTTFTLAHELGHAILHPKINTLFLKNKTFLSVNKLEIEANLFALNLLISDELLKDLSHLTIYQIYNYLGYSENLIKLRLTGRIY